MKDWVGGIERRMHDGEAVNREECIYICAIMHVQLNICNYYIVSRWSQDN